MDFHKLRTLRVVTISEKAAGFWPFQNKIRNGVICFLSILILHSLAIPLAVRSYRELGENVFIAVENMINVMVAYGISFKVLAAYLYRETRATMYKCIMKQLKKIDDEEESTIMKVYLNYGLKLTLAFIAIANLAVLVFDGPRLGAMISSMVFGNDTTDKVLPYYMDYYVDTNKYFEYVVLHLLLSIVVSIISTFAYDLSFVLAVHYTCALFKIVTCRLKTASEVAAKYRTVQGVDTENEREARRLLITVINIHQEALQMVTLIDDAYRVAWFVKLIETVVSTAGILSLLTLLTNELPGFLAYLSYLAFTLVQFNVAFNRGQTLVDHSSAVFDACCDSPWNSFSKESATLLRVMMIRSFKVSRLTGGKIFPLTNVMYMNMMKTAFSYFTVISSFVSKGDVPQ